jgi:hypothetical protein
MKLNTSIDLVYIISFIIKISNVISFFCHLLLKKQFIESSIKFVVTINLFIEIIKFCKYISRNISQTAKREMKNNKLVPMLYLFSCLLSILTGHVKAILGPLG